MEAFGYRKKCLHEFKCFSLAFLNVEKCPPKSRTERHFQRTCIEKSRVLSTVHTSLRQLVGFIQLQKRYLKVKLQTGGSRAKSLVQLDAVRGHPMAVQFTVHVQNRYNFVFRINCFLSQSFDLKKPWVQTHQKIIVQKRYYKVNSITRQWE